MNHSQAYDVHVLNELIVMALNSAGVYAEAAPESDKPRARFFEQRAEARIQLANRLQSEVLAFDGRWENVDLILAAAYAKPGGIQGTAADIDVGYDEHAFMDRFDAAINDRRVSVPVRNGISNAYMSVHGELPRDGFAA
jgi:hypothetical protein